MIFFFISIGACSDSNKNPKERREDSTIVEKGVIQKSASAYRVIGSGYFWNELDEGKFNIVKFKDGTIDSIDTSFGIYTLTNDAIVYLRVSKNLSDEFTSKKDSVYGSIGEYIISKNELKTPINRFAKHFQDYFSSPKLTNDKLYYWGLELVDSNGVYNIYASELNLISKKTINYFLFKDEVATDFRGYFPEPVIKNNVATYKLENGKKWTFSKDFKPLQ